MQQIQMTDKMADGDVTKGALQDWFTTAKNKDWKAIAMKKISKLLKIGRWWW